MISFGYGIMLSVLFNNETMMKALGNIYIYFIPDNCQTPLILTDLNDNNGFYHPLTYFTCIYEQSITSISMHKQTSRILLPLTVV